MLAHLAHAADAQRRFVADAAHELRTPLAGITAVLEVARQHPATTRPGELVDEMLAAHLRLNRLVADLLLLAAVEAGGASSRRQSVDLAGVVTDCLRRTRPAGIALHAEHLDPAVVRGDESQLARIVTNILDNALRHAAQHVQVRLDATTEHAVLTITDDGPGVPEADRQRIFDRFVRLDQDRNRATGGIGLGLALVRDLVDAHGGTVIVGDREDGGRGSRFQVRIPYALPDPS
jgi:signal transduction histidine kinase